MSGKILFDIGANVGGYAKARLLSGEFDRIVCVEANKSAFERLRFRFEGNTEVLPLFCAVSDEDNSKVSFFETEASVLSTANPDWVEKEGYRFYEDKLAKVLNTVEVHTVTIDKLIKFFGVPDLIKVDVEGFEETVLNGLSQHVPSLCFEWAEEMDEECERIVTRLQSLGFNEFAMQYDDKYTFYPDKYDPIEEFNISLLHTRDLDWGMIWVR